MSIKTKWVWGNKQEKVLLPRLALQYLLSNKRNKKCQVTPFQCAAEQTSHSTFHTSTQGCSQTHLHKDDGSADCLLTASRQLKTLQVPAGRGKDRSSETGDNVPPHLHRSLFQHWQRGYGFVALQGSYKACNVFGTWKGRTAQVRRCKCCQIISDQNQFISSITIYK